MGCILLGKSDLFSKENNNNEIIDNNDSTEDNNQDTEDDNKQEDNIQNLEITDSQAISLYDSITFYTCSLYKDYYYRTAKIIVKDLPNDIKTYFAARNTEGVGSNVGGYKIINESNLKTTYNKLYGKDVTYTFTATTNSNGLGLVEKRNNLSTEEQKYGNIIYFEADTCIPEIKTVVVKAEKNTTKNEYYIYEKVAFLKISSDINDILFNVYSDYTKTNLVSENVTNNGIIDKYSDKLNTYKYTFKSNGDGTYYFYSVERQ